MIIFAGIVSSLPNQIIGAFNTWVTTSQGKGPEYMITGVFQFVLYVISFIAIIAYVAFTEMAKRKIPVQSAGRTGGNNPKMSKASFLPIKLNSAGVIPVIFASSIMMTPTIIASFVSEDAANASWLAIFDSSKLYQMPGANGSTWGMPWGLLIYIALILVFSFFYSQMQINPSQLAENFQKNGSYIPGVRPGAETERYIKKVVNRVTCVGAISLAFIAALPVVLTLTIFQDNPTLAFGGTGLIIAVGVATELKSQISGLIAGKAYDKDLEGR
jgi:preprotein translocase subunit SecY